MTTLVAFAMANLTMFIRHLYVVFAIESKIYFYHGNLRCVVLPWQTTMFCHGKLDFYSHANKHLPWQLNMGSPWQV